MEVVQWDKQFFSMLLEGGFSVGGGWRREGENVDPVISTAQNKSARRKRSEQFIQRDEKDWRSLTSTSGD